jgi:hypothetical protein
VDSEVANREIEEPVDARVGISARALHHVAGFSAVAGLCPLIPVPFLDDVLIQRVHVRLYQKLSEQHEFYLAIDDAKLLAARESDLLKGALLNVVLWPAKKILRKLIYVLAVKSCADVAAAVFHEGWLMARVLEQGYVSRDALARGDQPTVRRLHDAIVAARDEVDPSVTRQVMRTAFGVGSEVVGPLVDAMRGVVQRDGGDAELDAAERDAAPISERIEHEIRRHWDVGPALDAALRQALGS